jgi:protoheme IX farnesyltransferase
MQGDLIHEPLRFLLVLIGLYLTGGAANGLNHVFEREIDNRMTRTRTRRPLPMGYISARSALFFSVFIGILGVLIFVVFFNILSAMLSLFTIVFYSFFYTLVLKRRTVHNTVIGGVAGAMAPVGAWAAASGTLTFEPWTLFLIIFFWSPPHFWALSLKYRDDYEKAGLIMLPIVKGERETLVQIYRYTWILFLISLTPLLFHAGWIYLAIALPGGLYFLYLAGKSRRMATQPVVWSLFLFSIIYLFGLFSALIADSLVPNI